MTDVDDNRKTCPFCGAPVSESADFCPACMENLPITVPDALSGSRPETSGSEEEKRRRAFAHMRRIIGAWDAVGMGVFGLGMLLHRIYGNPILTYGLVFLGLILCFIGFGYGYSHGSSFCPHCGRQPVPRMRYDPYCPHCKKRMW